MKIFIIIAAVMVVILVAMDRLEGESPSSRGNLTLGIGVVMLVLLVGLILSRPGDSNEP